MENTLLTSDLRTKWKRRSWMRLQRHNEDDKHEFSIETIPTEKHFN